MKVTVTIPNPTFGEAEWLAHHLGTTRSGLYARALEAFLAAQDPNWITDATNKVVDAIGAESGSAMQAQASDGVRKVEW